MAVAPGHMGLAGPDGPEAFDGPDGLADSLHGLDGLDGPGGLARQVASLAGGLLWRLAPSEELWNSTTFWAWVFWLLW